MAEVNKYVLWRHLLDPNSELYIYIWSKNFSHSVNEKSEAKWNQDGGHWRPIALKVVNSFYTTFPS
jgi:hypothetical protein